MSKNITIISYYFSPGNLMGAIRPTKLAKYLNLLEFQTKVITSKYNHWLFLNEKVNDDPILIKDVSKLPITRLPHSYFYKVLSSVIRPINVKLIKKRNESIIYKDYRPISLFGIIKKYSMFILSLIQDIDFLFMFIISRSAKRIIQNSDVIISTYGPYASHFAALYVKLKYKNKINWIADFRDPIAQSTDTILQNKINKYFEKIFCNYADSIVAVSNGYLNEITGNEFQDKKYVITNGFDLEDLTEEYKCNKYTDKFIFSYTGTTYHGKRDLLPLLNAINTLIADGSIDISKIEFHYAGPESEFISNLFKINKLDKILQNYGKVTRDMAIQICCSSQIIIIATWNYRNSTGVLPGKFFESIMFGKPLIVLINNETMGCEISDITKKFNLGISYESSNFDEDFESLKKYIHSEYNNFFYKKSIGVKLDQKKNPFNYKNISLEFSKLF